MIRPSRKYLGDAVGPWRPLEKLGQGGMGAVYEAEHATTHVRAALKVVSYDHARDPRFVERFRRESQLAKALKHPNVVACLDAGEEGGKLYLALELVRGGSLADRVKEGGLPWREVAQRGAEIARALGALHAVGIVHRDLKPANVLLGEKGEAKLTDFGLARDVAAASALTRTGELLGTVEYMAPEQAEGGAAVDARADLYALGCTLHALLVGHPPFPGSGPEVITKHLTELPARASVAAPETPPALDDLVASLLAKEPDARPGSASEVATALAAIARSNPGRSRAPLAVALAVLLLAVAGLGLAIAAPWSAPPAPPPPPPAPPPPPPPPVESPFAHEPWTDEKPAWFLALEKGAGPASLPAGVYYDKKAEGYWNARDRSELIYIPAGTFDPGPTVSEKAGIDGSLLHEVGPPRPVATLGAFFIGKYEVSNEGFERYASSKGAEKTDAEEGRVVSFVVNGREARIPLPPGKQGTWRDPLGTGKCDRRWPVVHLTRDDVQRYLAWAGLRLPTELEWERAAGWDEKTKKACRYPWGDEAPSRELAEVFTLEGVEPHLARVDSHPEGRSPTGAFNMTGNVWEYVEPWPRVKGGCFTSAGPNLEIAFSAAIEQPKNTAGFRVALSAGGD